ncbi:hypothetical protein HQ545_02635 [Candidatus Woesearchaeota archaeon]|nr:hypothetical protein [Candidatus Woesearchaeota archaeon]
MRVDNCPKNLRDCPESGCPMHPCWAYEQHMAGVDRNNKKQDSGWE